MNINVFELLDVDVDSHLTCGKSYLWDENFREGDFISIPKLVEEDSIFWRNKYLDWTYQLSNAVIDGKELYKHFKSSLINNDSFWWQSLIADKCPYKSKSPFVIIKIWVIEKLYTENNFEILVYRGDNKILAEVLSSWLRENNLGQFIWVKKRTNFAIRNYFKLNIATPIITSVFTIFQFLIRKFFYFRKVDLNQNADLTIVTYFPGVDHKKMLEGMFYSNYWGPLNDYLNDFNIPVNWVWIFTKQQINFRQAVKFQSILNSKSKVTGNKFKFIENNLSILNLCFVIKEFFRLGMKSCLCKFSIRNYFKVSGSKIDFFPILKNEWSHSFWGSSAMLNYIYAASFKNLDIPISTKKILYVWENQPWEQSLLTLKKSHVTTKFYGSVHTPANSTLFNLKVFPGNKNEFNILNGRRLPDFICAPSENARKILLEGGWPKDKVIIVEALRYIESLKNQMTTKRVVKNLLVVTGSIISEVVSQLNIIRDFENNYSEYFDNVFIKSHPLIPVEELLNSYNFQKKVKITNLKLSELWSNCSVVFTANSTSVGLEAYYLGIPLVISDSCGNFNLNSLFGVKGVHFINSSNEFKDVITRISLSDRLNGRNSSDFFCLDSEIPRWKNILNLSNSI